MKRLLFLFAALTFVLPGLRAEEKPHPALVSLEKKLQGAGIFANLPKGITLVLDSDEEPDESGWLFATLRQINGPGSGGDPNVSPALAHFYVRASDGEVQWYDVVEDKRRPFSDFVKDRAAP